MIRKPAVAGTFYPADKDTLSSMIDEFLGNAEKKKISGKLKAIIAPHAGYIYSGIVAAAGYNLIKGLDQDKKWKVVLLGPSHFVPFYNAAVPESDTWEFPSGNVEVKNIINELKDMPDFKEDELMIKPMEEPFTQEHSLEVQVPFLQKTLKNFTLYPLCLGEFNPSVLADQLKKFVEQKDVILVISSDLSHYYPYEEAIKIDENANQFIPQLNIDEVGRKAEACGMKGVLTCMHLAQELGWKAHLIDYKNSGDTAGDKAQVVGYGCYAFTK